ncbi:MAG TPA: carbon storage regulator [Roseateles sp.]
MSTQPTGATTGFNIIDVKVGETIRLESVDFGEISVTINAKDGQRVRLGVKAAKNVKVHRPARKAG